MNKKDDLKIFIKHIREIHSDKNKIQFCSKLFKEYNFNYLAIEVIYELIKNERK